MPIRLRPLDDSDLDRFFDWERDPAGVAMAAFTPADPSDRSAFDAHYARIRADPDVLERAIEVDGALVGKIASFTVEGHREISYWVDPDRWGRGFASAGLAAFLELELTRPLRARVAEHNIGSATVLTRAGFTRVDSEIAYAAGVGRDVVEHIYRLDEQPARDDAAA